VSDSLETEEGDDLFELKADLLELELLAPFLEVEEFDPFALTSSLFKSLLEVFEPGGLVFAKTNLDDVEDTVLFEDETTIVAGDAVELVRESLDGLLESEELSLKLIDPVLLLELLLVFELLVKF
jgi:hypothetical protein